MFHKCKTEEDGKKLFRKLSLRLHPDCGGSNELMVLLQESYEIFLKKTGGGKEKVETKIFKGDERLRMLEIMEIFADEHETYDPKFLHSICAFLAKAAFITVKQYEALSKEFERHKMQDWWNNRPDD
jgi:curved DNA-binding protein CbpA